MTEKSHTPIGGLPQNFDLGAILDQQQNVELYAAQAARNMFDTHEQIKQDAMIDEKTGLLVQAAWMENLNRVLHESDNLTGTRAYVADLNGFKAVNDALGHAEGDKLLGIVARAFTETFRRGTDAIAHGDRENPIDSQNIARLGGDEFAVFTVPRNGLHAVDGKAPHADEHEPEAQKTRLNHKLTELLAGTHFEQYGVTIAMGSAMYEPGESTETLFARADMAMFEEKYADKLSRITDEDMKELEVIIPYMENLGLRVESWIKTAVNTAKTDRVS